MEKIMFTLNAKLMAANRYAEVIREYKSLSGDEERVICTLNIMSEYNIIPQARGDAKNVEASQTFRKQGNILFVTVPFKITNYVEAFKLYTKSIAYAPYASNELGLAYSNRSAVLLKLCKYEECIKDIDKALPLVHEDNIKAKLYVRKVECLNSLKHSETESTLQMAQECLQKMSMDDDVKEKLNNKLISVKNIKLPQKVQKQSKVEYQTLLSSDQIKVHNTEVPCASDALTIKYSEKYGRHVIANRDIRPGEIIVVEKAYSSILSTKNLYTHCSNCLEVCWTTIPCNYCTFVMYCSEECKATAWKNYHDVECPIVPCLLAMDFYAMLLFGLRITVQAIRESSSIEELKELLKEVDSSVDPRTKGFSKNGVFESDKYRSILSLVTNSEKRSVQDLFERSMSACYMLYFLATYSNLFGKPLEKDLSVLVKDTDVTFVGGLIMRHLQMISTNMHTLPEGRGLDVVGRGIVAMPFLSLLNHSCNSNIARTSIQKQMATYALYPIKKGEQILDNYSQFFAINPLYERQKELLQQYYFECNCEACRNDWPMYFDLKSYKNIVTNKKDQRKINNALKEFDLYMEIAEVGNVFDKPYIIENLSNAIEVLYSLVRMPCAEMIRIVETLKRVYDLHGNRFDLPKL